MNFENLGLSAALQKALANAGYSEPTAVQAKTIPLVLQGRDVMVTAQTGTGKTAGFVSPVLDLLSANPSRFPNQINALILVPTRELAIQIHQSIKDYGSNSNLRTSAVYGGVKINPQMMNLRGGLHLLVATPGRLLDLHQKNAVAFNRLNLLVLDEADRMLSLGFADEMSQLLKLLPAKRQTLLFSATLTPQVKRLAAQMLHKPTEITINPERIAAAKIKQWLAPTDEAKKTNLLLALLAENNWEQVMVFVNTKRGADILAKHLSNAGVSTAVIHGDKSQSVRLRNLRDFKLKKSQILIGTDLASRGLDIDDLPVVVNLELPKVAEDYVHRIGRTGRAGRSGEAISLVSANEYEKLRAIEQLLQEVIQREYIDGFMPKQDVPESKGVPSPRKPQKPKKPKKLKKQKHRAKTQNPA